jgi:hypothetical protein
MSDRVEGNIVYTESPDKVVDIENVLLVRLSSKNRFEKANARCAFGGCVLLSPGPRWPSA